MAEPAAMEHLSTEELGRRYRAARDRVERSHLQVIWLLREGYGAGEVARVMGYSARWVAEIVRRYHAQGPEGLVDGRRGSPPRPGGSSIRSGAGITCSGSASRSSAPGRATPKPMPRPSGVQKRSCRHGWPRFKRRIPRLGARPGRWMSADSASSR